MRRQALSNEPVLIQPLAAIAPEATPRRTFFGMRELVVCLVLLAAFASGFGSPTDFDYWWHLANGRYIATRHALAVPDVFSYTAAGRHWIAHEWLSDLITYGLHHAFGVTGPLALYGVCLALLAWLLYLTLWRIGVRMLPATVWIGVALVALVPFVGPRPQVAAFMLLAAELWLLERWVARRDGSIWLLPALIWLWGNLHGSFAAGIAVPVLLLAADLMAEWFRWPAARLDGTARRTLAGAVALAIGALCINPNGPALLIYPFTKFGNPLLKYLGEWIPSDFSDPRFWAFGLLVGTYVTLLVLRRPRVPASDLLTAAAFTGGALWSARFVPFAALCLVLCLGRVLVQPNESGISAPSPLARIRDWYDERARRYAQLSPAQQAMNVGVLVLALVAFKALIRPWNVAQDPTLPVAAVNHLGSAGLPEPLFNDYNWGGYLIWRLWPRTRVFIDGRGDDLYTKGGELRAYVDVSYLHADTEQILNRYHIQTILYLRDTALVRFLLATGGWRATYDDGRVVVLQRKA